MVDISIIIPVFNEEKNIPLIEAAVAYEMGNLALSFEIIFVDDGSQDDSLEIIKSLSKDLEHVKFLSFSRNFGQQAAMTAGMDFAKGKAVITMDADFQDPPEMIPQMIEKWREGFNIVYTRRIQRADGFFKKSSANLYYYLLKKFTDLEYQGNVGEFRLVDRQVLDELIKLREKTRYLRGIINWMGYRHTCLDYRRPNRKEGKTGFTLVKMARLGMSGILNFSLLPLRLGLVIGLIVIFLGVSFLAYIAVDSIFNDVVYQLYKWLSVVTFIFTGLLFVFIWILGEYIGKIYNESKDRPIYLIREKGNLN